jgi:hypothetical protein
VGGTVRKLIESRNQGTVRQEKRERGVLFSSGMIAGAALVGVIIAAVIFFAERVSFLGWLVANWTIGYEWMGRFATPVGIVIFALLVWFLYRLANRTETSPGRMESN